MAKKKKSPLSICGVDTLGRPTFSGTFKMADTLGFSLTDSLWWCREHGAVVCLVSYINDALAANWPAERIAARIREAWFDCGLRDEWPQIEEASRAYLERKGTA